MLRTSVTGFLTIILVATLFFSHTMAQTEIPQSAPSGESKPKEGFRYNPGSGFQYVKDDFKWTTWGYAERVMKPDDGGDYWRRIRQGMEFLFPRYDWTLFGSQLRSAFVYEVDFTDNDFGEPKGAKIWENLYATIQDAEDPVKLRLLFGENTHILSREDNLSSGNLPLINRSLVLEDYGSTNNFGTQFGFQFQKLLNEQTQLQLSLQDNRGTLNSKQPRYYVLNDWAAKVNYTVLKNEASQERGTVGFAADFTRDIHDTNFTLGSAIDRKSLGEAEATGNKASFAGDAYYTNTVFGKNYSVEGEVIYSNYSDSNTDVIGGYVQGQYLVFDTWNFGDLVPVLRYDVVHLATGGSSATQQALRVGLNYNLPFTNKLVNLHLEYARNHVAGADSIVPHDQNANFNEFAVELRISLTRYLRF
jgi:hypothetical protein